MAKQSYWFKHDYNSRSDGRLINLQMALGMEGVGIYWCVIEMLYEEGGYLFKTECERIAFELRTDSDKIRKVVESSLFECENDKFWSESVLRRLGKSKEKSDKNSTNAKKRWDDERKKKEEDANAMRTHNDGNATSMLRREDKIREEILTSNYNPQIPENISEHGIVQEMIRVWKKYKPLYQVEQTYDFPACLQIAYKIAGIKGWKKEEVVNGKMQQTIKSWETIVAFAYEHNHYGKLDLQKIKTQWNGLVDTMEIERKVADQKTQKETERLKQTCTTSMLIPKYSAADDAKYD